MLSSHDIEKLIEPYLEKEKTKLCDVKVSGHAGKPLIQLFLDWEEKNITIEACAKISRYIQDLIDMQDWALTNYQLIVSSPGIDSPLNQLWQFRKNIGRIIRYESSDDSFEGRLVGVGEDGILKLEMNGDIKEFDSDLLCGAKVVVEIPRKNKTKRNRNEA